MATYYVDSNATGAGTGADWANAFATLAAVAAVDAAGDIIRVAHNHAESSGSTQSLAFAGTPASPVIVACVNTSTGEAATTASITCSGLSVSGSVIWDGVSVASSNSIYINSAAGSVQLWLNCELWLNTANSGYLIGVGVNGTGAPPLTLFTDVALKFGNAGQKISAYNGYLKWSGGTLSAGGTSPTLLVETSGGGRPGDVEIENIDLSNMATSGAVYGVAHGPGKQVARGIKLPSGWTGSIGSGTYAPARRIELHDYVVGSTKHPFASGDLFGTIMTERTIVRTGGADDGTAYSWRMGSSSSASIAAALESTEFAKYNDSTSSITATVEIVTDSATALTDGEIWLEVSYPGASGKAIVTDAKASVLATAADQASSSVDWTTTGLSTPLKQKLSATFTPGAAGWLQAKVKLAKPSTTVYVDPVLTVA